MSFSRNLLASLLALTLLSGCFGDGNQQDLEDFIVETKRRPKKPIEPLPSFEPFEPFTYSATRLRNPFEQPMAEVENLWARGSVNVKPDFDRNKEFLEDYSFDAMSLVGFIEMKGDLQALIDYGESGQVQRVRIGNYLGKNHGRVVAIEDSQLRILEIVSDGLDGWIERPRQLTLIEKD